MPKFFEIANKPHGAEAQQATAAGPEAGAPVEGATMMPPFMPAGAAGRGASPGVVPPPAAPMYSMHPPEPARVEGDTETAEIARSRRTRGTVQESVRLAVQRTRMPAAAAQGARRSAGAAGATIPLAAQPTVRPTFDPVRAAQAGLLNLAWKWQESGSPIRAIHAYLELIGRYPDTPAAAAAVADLVALSDKLAEEGQFQTALAIYEHLERML